MEELRKFLLEYIDDGLIRIIISGAKETGGITKIRVRPVKNKEKLLFQTASQKGKQEFHENLEKEELVARLVSWMEVSFKQLQMETTQITASVLVSKKGKITIKKKNQEIEKPKVNMEHNRKKQYILEEGIAVPFLVDLGIMTREGKVVKPMYDKFRQINRFLEFIEDILPHLDKRRELKILDFGCGKSYLTFAMYYYLRILKGMNIQIIGLDLKDEVIEHCNEMAIRYEYEKLVFRTGDIASYEGVNQVDMVVTLHACDTATDYALEKAVKWGARVILSVPCCQHELNNQIHSQVLEPVLKYGLIRERMAALLTDALRAGYLEEAGYQVQILEFIDMEHTPKNILIRAIYTGNHKKDTKLEPCMELLGVDPLLGKLLEK